MAPGVRFSVSDKTLYYGFVRAGNPPSYHRRVISKVVSASKTDLWSDDDGAGPPQNQKVQVSGSSLSLYDDLVLAQTITDTAISSGTHVGLAGHNTSTLKSRGDNFIAEDLTVTFKGRLLKRDPACRTLFGGLIHA
jgi:hypothetical protein